MEGKTIAKGYIRKIKCPACKGKGYLEEKVTIADATFEDAIRSVGDKK